MSHRRRALLCLSVSVSSLRRSGLRCAFFTWQTSDSLRQYSYVSKAVKALASMTKLKAFNSWIDLVEARVTFLTQISAAAYRLGLRNCKTTLAHAIWLWRSLCDGRRDDAARTVKAMAIFRRRRGFRALRQRQVHQREVKRWLHSVRFLVAPTAARRATACFHQWRFFSHIIAHERKAHRAMLVMGVRCWLQQAWRDWKAVRAQQQQLCRLARLSEVSFHRHISICFGQWYSAMRQQAIACQRILVMQRRLFARRFHSWADHVTTRLQLRTAFEAGERQGTEEKIEHVDRVRQALSESAAKSAMLLARYSEFKEDYDVERAAMSRQQVEMTGEVALITTKLLDNPNPNPNPNPKTPTSTPT